MAELGPSSLIICSRNRPQLLREAVASILAGDVLPAEVLIVDQSDVPDHDLAEWPSADGCEIRYLFPQTRGLSRANNLAISLARYELLAFTHDDVRVSPAWFGALMSALHHAGPVTVVTGQVLPADDREEGFVPLTKVDNVPAAYAGRVWQDVLYPLNMAMYRSAIAAVGSFDERLGPGTAFYGAEDNDFGFRLLEAGYEIRYVPEAIVYHRAWRPARDYLRLRREYGTAQGAFYAKHMSLRDRYILQRLCRELGHRWYRLCRRGRDQGLLARGDIIYVGGLAVGFIQWLIRYRLGRLLRGARQPGRS